MYTNKPETPQCARRVLQGMWLITVLFTSCSFAQSADPATDQLENTPTDYYRIELILFRVLNGSNYGRLSGTISDYTEPVILEDLTELDHLGVQSDKLDEEEVSTEEIGIEEIEILRSEVMENAWKRLNGSHNFRPVAYLQWDELRADTVSRHSPGGVEGIATRAHGEDILIETAEEIPIVEDEIFQYLEENILETLIVPEPVYKLDGRATFGQGRFLHIELDFEFRSLNADVVTLLNQLPEPAEVQFDHRLDAEGTLEDKTTVPSYTIFAVKKSRQIVPQKPELFDNEQFGVLVYLEEVSITEELLLNTEIGIDENR